MTAVAKALECPDCGHRHPLDSVDGETFRCGECHRMLKVPPRALPETPAGNGQVAGERTHVMEQAAPPDDPDATRPVKVPPSQRRGAAGAASREVREERADPVATTASVPRFARVLVWMVALPAGFVPVVVVGRLTGLFEVDSAIDVFVGVGPGRFVPLLLMLPTWAALTATIAHFGIEGLGRFRSRPDR